MVYIDRSLNIINLKTQEMIKNSTLSRKINSIFTGINLLFLYPIRSVFKQPEAIRAQPLCYKEVQKMLLEDYRTW